MKTIILKQTLKFKVYPEDLGVHNWEDANKVCKDLGDGWRLPTREELHLMWLNRESVGNFADYGYWSSTEDDGYDAWLQYFYNGEQTYSYKNTKYGVRAVRALTKIK